MEKAREFQKNIYFCFIGCSLSGSFVCGIFPAILLEWVTISFSTGSSRLRDQTQVYRIAADTLLSEPPWKLSNYYNTSLVLHMYDPPFMASVPTHIFFKNEIDLIIWGRWLF